MATYISYDPLWTSLGNRDLNRTRMAREIGISKSTLAKLGHDENVSLEVICRICAYLNCAIEDVMEIKHVG